MTDALCTFIIPCADYHRDIVQAAIDSVQAQTLHAAYEVVYDTGEHHPGILRNRGAMKATTPFVSFLDADDTLTPDYLETALQYWQPRHYVYTDWLEDGTRVNAPDCEDYYTRHLVNMLISRETFVWSGGFGKTLIEDTEYYWRIRSKGICGIRCNHALVHYTAGGRRGKTTANLPNSAMLETELTKAYQIEAFKMCNCNTPDSNLIPAAQDGMIQAHVLPGYNKRWMGQATGTMYPNAGHGKIINVYPQDVEAMPHVFQAVAPDIRPLDTDGIVELMKRGLRQGA